MADEIISENAGTVRLRATPRLWSILQANRISFGARDAERLGFVDLPKTARIEQYADYTNGNTLHTMGACSYTMTNEGALTVGRYCSIADQTMVMGERHPVEHVTTSSFPYRAPRPSFAWMRQDHLDNDQTFIPPTIRTRGAAVLEHDVWTGNRVILARGITLHTGAIAAAGSVVTRDVPPYAIVAGNPARIIRLRFPESIVERLLASRWWDAHPRALFACDITQPERFLDQLDAARAALPAFALTVLGWDTLAPLLSG